MLVNEKNENITVVELLKKINTVHHNIIATDFSNIALHKSNLINVEELLGIIKTASDLTDNKDFTNNFFGSSVVIEAIILSPSFNKNFLKYLPDFVKDVSLRTSTYPHKFKFDDAIEKIYFDENMTLEKFKLIEENFNIKSLDNFFLGIDSKEILEDEELNSNKNLNYFFNYDIPNDNSSKLLDSKLRYLNNIRATKDYPILKSKNSELFDYIMDNNNFELNKEIIFYLFMINVNLEHKDAFNDMSKKINYDISSFNKLIQENYLYLSTEYLMNDYDDSDIVKSYLINLDKPIKLNIKDYNKYLINAYGNHENNFFDKIAYNIIEQENSLDFFQKYSSITKIMDEVNFINDLKEYLGAFSNANIEENKKTLIEENNVLLLREFENFYEHKKKDLDLDSKEQVKKIKKRLF